MSDQVVSALALAAEARADEGFATVGDVLRVVESVLTRADRWPGHAYDSHAQEARALLRSVLGLQRVDDVQRPARMTRSEREAAFDLLQRRLETRTPLPYLVGRTTYAGLEIEVEPGTFIPRNALGHVLEEVLATVNWSEVPRMLDLGTGVGAIGVAVAARRRDVRVDATDIEELALQVAARNARRHRVHDRMTFLRGSLFEPVDDASRYDLISANLPYVPESSRQGASAEVHKEPSSAIFSRGDGLDLVRALLVQAPAHLSDKGTLVLEVAVGRQSREVDWILAGRGRWWSLRDRPLGLVTVSREELTR